MLATTRHAVCLATIVSVVVSLASATTVTSAGAVVTEMTPAAIEAAITLGSAAKEMPRYEIRRSGFVGSTYKPVLGAYSTPFLRVAQAARAAKLEYKSFTAAGVPPDLLALELHVYGFAQADGASVSNVKTIVITRKGSTDPATALRAERTEPIPVTIRNLYGMSANAEGLLAVFPLKLIRADDEVHIIYDGRVHDGGANKYCQDCAVPLELSKVQ